MDGAVQPASELFIRTLVEPDGIQPGLIRAEYIGLEIIAHHDEPGAIELQVVGEMENVSGQDLTEVALQAYVEGEPAFPVWSSVGCGDGTIGHGAKGSAAFTLPLQPGDKTAVVIAGIEAYEGQDVYPVPVSGVSETRQGEDFLVSATLSNPTASWLWIKGLSLIHI